MFRIARFICVALVLMASALPLASCDLLTNPADKLYHVTVFNDGPDDVVVQSLNCDVKGEVTTVVLNHQTGVCSFDWKKYGHTIVVKHIYTGQILATYSNLEPNSIKGERSHDGYDHLDAYLSVPGGGWEN